MSSLCCLVPPADTFSKHSAVFCTDKRYLKAFYLLFLTLPSYLLMLCFPPTFYFPHFLVLSAVYQHVLPLFFSVNRLKKIVFFLFFLATKTWLVIKDTCTVSLPHTCLCLEIFFCNIFGFLKRYIISYKHRKT